MPITRITIFVREVASHHAGHVNGKSEVIYQILPNVLIEARLILQFISDHNTDSI